MLTQYSSELIRNFYSLSLDCPVSEMTHTVLSVTLNCSTPYHTCLSIAAVLFAIVYFSFL